MAASHETIVFDVEDLKVYALVDDTGASPVYGAAVDVFGVSELSVEPQLVTAELKGDGGRVLAKRGKADRLTVSVTYGRLSGDVLDVILGTTTSDPSGTQARTRLVSGTSLPYFKLAALVSDTDRGIESVHITLYKCQLTGGSLLSQSTDEFGQPSFEAEAIGLDVTGGSSSWPTGLIADIDLYTVETPLP